MRIENKHVFTAGAQSSKKVKGPDLSKPFKAGAPFSKSGKSLKGRVEIPEEVTKRGENLTKKVGQILQRVPTPFIKR